MKLTARSRLPRSFNLHTDVPVAGRRFHDPADAPTIMISPLSRENLVMIQDSVMHISMSQADMGGEEKNININMRSNTVNYNKIINSIFGWTGFADANGHDISSSATSLANKKALVDALTNSEYDALVAFMDNAEDSSNLQ